jgi:hypothetical protein
MLEEKINGKVILICSHRVDRSQGVCCSLRLTEKNHEIFIEALFILILQK